MIPPGVIAPRKPAPRLFPRRYGASSAVLSFLTLAFGLLVTVWPHFFPKPLESYPLAKTLEPPTARELILMDANGRPFARRGGCYGEPVSMSELPDHFVHALLAMEDRRFYDHFGLDPVGIMRAAFSNYNAGKIVQGGSTITQQLAKISYLSGAKTYERKLEEALAVLRLELALTKDDILERYLSRAYFGEGCYGLRGAARHYFGASVKDLTLAQSTRLVALLKSPAALAANPKRLHRRERLVLQTMSEQGWIGGAALAGFEPAKEKARTKKTFGAYYADWVAETADLPQDGGMKALPVRTSLDPKLQRLAEKTVEGILKRNGKSRKASQAALVAMRPNGQVLAMVGGLDHGRSQFNRAAHAMRQPGSSFKTFVYLAAMRAGGHPEMLVADEPITIGNWSPENYSHKYRGIVSLRQAYSSSINTVAVRVSEAVGRKEVIAAARDLGITTKMNPDPSIALGTSEVTLLELTAAYAAIAAGAYPVKPWGITSMGDAASKRTRPPKGAGQWRLMQRETMRDFMSSTVQYGTARGARLPIPAYGKTGTSQNYRDAWFIGFAGNLVVGVWVGNDDNSPMARVTGGNLPAMIWRDFMNKARRADKRFTASIANVHAFPNARTPHPRAVAHAGRLESILIPGGGMYADNPYYDPYDRRAMMFARRYGQEAYEERYRRRLRGRYERSYRGRYGQPYENRYEQPYRGRYRQPHPEQYERQQPYARRYGQRAPRFSYEQQQGYYQPPAYGPPPGYGGGAQQGWSPYGYGH